MERTRALELLKAAVPRPTILRLPRVDLPFSVDTDACEYQIGWALMQGNEDGTRYSIGFWSRSLLPAEKNYSVRGKHCLAVVWAVQLLRPYLKRKRFELFTDHRALKWLLDLCE